jgi:DNA adenine methylase
VSDSWAVENLDGWSQVPATVERMGALRRAIDDEVEEWRRWVPGANPLFKWAGGKQRFLWDHRADIPEFEGRYFEPFAGGLSVFFHVARRSDEPVRARLSDTNLRLVRAYQEVRRDWRSVNDELRQLEAGFQAAEDRSKFYYSVRVLHNRLSPAPDSARFIFLMRAGWNGVYRVNQRGEFNVPHGKLDELPGLPGESDIRAVAQAFKHVEIRANSWESSISDVKAGDFVFLDPPYFSETRSQLYDKNKPFGIEQHTRLADYLVTLQQRNVQFILTNSGHPAMIDLYVKRGLQVRSIDMHRSISSKIGGRGTEAELIVTPGQGMAQRTAAAALDLKMKVRAQARVTPSKLENP